MYNGIQKQYERLYKELLLHAKHVLFIKQIIT